MATFTIPTADPAFVAPLNKSYIEALSADQLPAWKTAATKLIGTITDNARDFPNLPAPQVSYLNHVLMNLTSLVHIEFLFSFKL